ncbi:hypothetical protein [Streptomyces europaeiscabiei]|uniref:hypothetical protein n=1 Tax=Streptomyces europaeiscabiei TaxID=146819 RepID=UPI0029B406AC|nr:hypothetical protein [Streptomyces europaeiscabiei]MDX3839568.1 hypothetical protein [Streptomyces europaeiscabiei]
MRIRLTDGKHEVEIKAKGYSRRRLDDAEASALRMLDALRSTEPTNAGTTFGFTRGHSLDGVALDSTTERAERFLEADRDDDGEDGQV